MPFSVDVSIDKSFQVACPFDTVFDTVADVPYSAGHFPKVDELVDLGDECYRWEMQKIGLDRWSIQTVYACEYGWDKEEGTVEWVPVEDEGNAVVEGSWTIEAIDGETTGVTLTTEATLTLPLPGLAKMIVSPIVAREFEGMVDEYVQNLINTWTS